MNANLWHWYSFECMKSLYAIRVWFGNGQCVEDPIIPFELFFFYIFIFLHSCIKDAFWQFPGTLSLMSWAKQNQITLYGIWTIFIIEWNKFSAHHHLTMKDYLTSVNVIYLWIYNSLYYQSNHDTVRDALLPHTMALKAGAGQTVGLYSCPTKHRSCPW